MNREEFFDRFVNWSSDDVRRIQIAYWLSKDVHRTTQSRDSGERYFEHPRRVAAFLADRGYDDAEVIVLALLHDAIEDSTAPISIYRQLFGDDTARRLLLLSKKIPRFESFSGMVIDYHRKSCRRYFSEVAAADTYVRLVKICDRIDNVTTCDVWEEDRRRKYAEETKKYVLPIASLTDNRLYHVLVNAVSKIA